MSVNPRTLRLVNGLRLQVSGYVDEITRDLVSAWAHAWDEAQAEVQAAVDELIDVGAGEWPTRWQIARVARAQRALEIARVHLDVLTISARIRIVDATGLVVGFTAATEPHIISSQYPPGFDTAVLTASFDLVSSGALEEIVHRTTQQVVSLTKPLSEEATDAMHRSLIRGVFVGENPRVAASQMMERVEGDFNGGLNRAMVIARTEILDAHRAAAKAQQLANTDVVAGWVWLSQMDKRTCPSCFAMSGSEHPVTEDGPKDHQQGRCARVPITKTWSELGFPDLEEPPSIIPDSRQTFDSLPQDERLQVMGPQRLALLDSGEISWSDLATTRHTDGWRDSVIPTPVKELV